MKIAKALLPLLAVLAAPPPAAAQTHVDNPFSGAKMYVNPDYTANANSEAAKVSGTLATNMRTVGQQPTAVWMDRISAVSSLSTHLDQALAQGANLFLGVVYDLPGRDCAALASNGELPATADGLAQYKSQYIDAIAAVVKQSKYANLRIVFVVEPDSLPNLVTNLSDPECSAASSSGIYVQGVQYAVNTLHAIPNVYLYIDMAHSGWLGWPNNSSGFISLMNTVSSGFTAGKGAIDGFIDDTANTLPLVEPFMTGSMTVGGQQVMSAKFYEYNPDIDETSYLADMWSRFSSAGWPSSMGFLMDTSRNGWGGSARPTGPSTSTDLNTFVTASKVDRRAHRGLWCNPSGAGIGERPKASPGVAHVDAFVWVKPPGESDGASTDIPNTEGKKFDRMCDPTYTTQYGVPTGALAGAPLAGQWFSAQFQQLVQNAYPAFGSTGPTCSGIPTAPTGLTASVSGTTVTLSWNAVTPPSGCSITYTVHRATSSNFTPSTTTQVAAGVTTTTYAVTGLNATTTYWFKVQAVDQNGAATSSEIQAQTQQGGTSGPYALSIAKAGTGAGTVTSSSGGINCGASCSATYTAGTTVTLTATASSGSTFTSWSGCTTTNGNLCILSMTQARSVIVTFTSSGGTTGPYTLTVAKAGMGSGSGTVTGGGINCGSTCSASFASGTTVTLTAVAASGSTFTSWSGCTTTNGSLCTVSMTQARSVTATFTGPGSTGSPCANPVTFTGNTGNFNTTGAVCYRTSQRVSGWGCSNFGGRTISVNGGTATSSCGAGPFPLAQVGGYTYFSATAGQYPWASIYVW